MLRKLLKKLGFKSLTVSEFEIEGNFPGVWMKSKNHKTVTYLSSFTKEEIPGLLDIKDGEVKKIRLIVEG